jgi:hypothetical protein
MHEPKVHCGTAGLPCSAPAHWLHRWLGAAVVRWLAGRRHPHMVCRHALRSCTITTSRCAVRAAVQTDAWSGFKKLFSFGKKEAKEDDGQPKKIIWASQYGKYQAEQKAKKANKGGK